MNALSLVELSDVQSRVDERGVALDEVGIADLRFPIQITGREGAVQSTVGTFELAVDVPAGIKGTHMSRFVEVLQSLGEPLTPLGVTTLAGEVRERLGSQRAVVRTTFPYFLMREAPVSGLAAPLEYEGSFTASFNGSPQLEVGLCAPVASLCPCSKEISDYGAHNQRGYVELHVTCSPSDPVWLEDLVGIAEESASAPVYPLLKRIDERHVTMQAYENPAFVEDVARDAALALRADPRIQSYRVRVMNLESIHGHNAVATVTGTRS